MSLDETIGTDRSDTLPADPAIETASRPDDTAILLCRNIWKVFGGAGIGAAMKVLSLDAPTSVKRERLMEQNYFCAISDVSLEVRRGEILMVMGLSGSGKSTLLRCMSRLVEPTSGAILLDGRDLLKADRRDLIEIRRNKIGMVFQNFGLLPHLTALDNVTFPLRVQGMGKSAMVARGREMLDLVGLGDRALHYPHQLSGGQQQRVGIARSLAGDPDLWFLDEPFSALDPLIRRQMQDEFLRLQSQLDKTIVFVTHDFAEAARLGDRIALMRDGQVVQVGTAAEIMLAPADDYVRGFVADVPLMRAIKLRHVALDGGAGMGGGASGIPLLDGNLALESALPLFLDGVAAIAVGDSGGRRIGVIGRERFSSLIVADRQARA